MVSIETPAGISSTIAEKALSDSGSAAEKLYRRLDISPEQESAAEEAKLRRREKLIEEARNRLLFLRLEKLLPVFDEIVASNGKRGESIKNLSMKRNLKKDSAKRFYDRGVAALNVIFSQ